ncbi:hypothetical protein D3C79_680940 [compost metagenome]
MADTAKVSEMGLALWFQIASRACDSASSPVDTVTRPGTLSISCGSINATCGQVHARCREYFFCRALSHNVAQGVTSLPVPAVVGAAISGLCRAGVNDLPLASNSSSSSKLPDCVPTISALAVSMALPPPRAKTLSQSPCSAQNRSCTSRNQATSGFGCTVSITQTRRSPSRPRTRSTSPN